MEFSCVDAYVGCSCSSLGAPFRRQKMKSPCGVPWLMIPVLMRDNLRFSRAEWCCQKKSRRGEWADFGGLENHPAKCRVLKLQRVNSIMS